MTSGAPIATVVIPTTGDRAALTEQALWSIRRQTVGDWEAFVIGDGVSPAARDACRMWAAEDARIRFFDHPKHPRRGEEYRHSALLEHARGTFVCYLCDRDLYLPHHLEVLAAALDEVDFAHTLPVSVLEGDALNSNFEAAIWVPEERLRMGIPLTDGHGIPLSFAGHRLDFYRKLETGWSTTPSGSPTDISMWRKFLSHPECTFRSCHIPTVIHLPRGTHPGWPPERRLAEMLRWREKMQQPGFYERFLQQVIEILMNKRTTRAAGTLRRELGRRLAAKEQFFRWQGGAGNVLRAWTLRALRTLLRPFGG